MVPPHLLLDLSDKRRAFAVGDIHGEFGLLEEALAEVAFDTEHDMLVSVGDLVDRGPNSIAALDLLTRPWVRRALGNHDIMPRMVLDRQMERHDFRDYGGGWILDLGDVEMNRIATILEDAPAVITVITPGGHRVGIAHADCGRNWDEHVAGVMDPRSRTWRTDMSLWSRTTINDIRTRMDEDIPIYPGWARVAGVDHVFHGHTIMGEPYTLANRSWIDTGAYKRGVLTLVDMDAWIMAHPDDATADPAMAETD